MAEELRFFLRTALFALGAGAVYWFVSYEPAGTFLFAFVVIGAGFFTFAVGFLVRGTRPKTEGEDPQRNKIAGAAYRTLGFAEHPGDADRPPLEVGEELIPPSSIWPLAAAAASFLVGLGLIFGAWFWAPGLAVGAVTAYGWVTELTR